MAYIETHQTLPHHPKTSKAGRLLQASKVTVIGHLTCLWLWALDFAQDGDLSRYELDEIAGAAMWEGDPEHFVTALCECGAKGQHGFLERDEDGNLRIHDWEEFAGKLLRIRQLDAERKREARQNNGLGRPPDVHRTSTGTDVDVCRKHSIAEQNLSKQAAASGARPREAGVPTIACLPAADLAKLKEAFTDEQIAAGFEHIRRSAETKSLHREALAEGGRRLSGLLRRVLVEDILPQDGAHVPVTLETAPIVPGHDATERLIADRQVRLAAIRAERANG